MVTRMVRIIALLTLSIGPGACSGGIQKPPFYAHSVAGEIASGLTLSEQGYDIDRAKLRPGYDRPTCNSPFAGFMGKTAPYWNCLVIGSEYTECNKPFADACVSLEGAAYLLREPERLEKVIDSMAHPCKYLPAPEQIRTNPEIPNREVEWFVKLWREAKCDTHPGEYPGEVILQLFEGENHVKTFIKPAKQ